MEILSSMFLEFLRSKRSELLWTDSEDSKAKANLYQMMIKVITEGKVPEMVLLHYKDLYYNLIIEEKSELALFGALSDHVESVEDSK